MTIHRSIEKSVKSDLEKKIVLLSGPRQCGKTTLSKQLYPHYDYINYDDFNGRATFLEQSWQKDVDLVILDEIHKHNEWKRLIKGVYDTQGIRPRLLVTGSAKMDTYRKMGDSLAGRYFRHRLYPLDPKEIIQAGYGTDTDEIVEQLLQMGGFPEPFLNGNVSYYKKWRKTHIDIILRQDLLDLEEVRDIKTIETLIHLLRKRVGSPVSYASLAEDLQRSPITIKRWLNILEQLYIIFSVRPYHRNVARAILKAPKYYFYDTGLVEGDGERLENLVALSLLKNLHMEEDQHGDDVGLHYIQTRNGKEVDFCIQKNDHIHLIEVKKKSDSLSKNLIYFQEKVGASTTTQLVQHLKKEKHFPNGIQVRNLGQYLATLQWETE